LKPIILTISCELYRHNGFNDAVRETWLKIWADCVCDYKFVLGRGCDNPREDELVFDVDDGYRGMSYKSQAMHRWVIEHGYSHTFHCSTDTYIIVPRLLSSNFESGDYIGCAISGHWPEYDAEGVYRTFYHEPYAQLGAGGWLSSRSSSIIAKSNPSAAGVPFTTADDLWIGQVLRQSGIRIKHDARYCHDPARIDWALGDVFPNDKRIESVELFRQHQDKLIARSRSNDIITLHLSRGEGNYKPEWMRAVHQSVTGE
jgi:hypothetical protein